MSLAAAMLASTALASSTSGPAVCPACTLDAPAHVEAMPLLVVLRPDDGAGHGERAWRGPALEAGWAVLTLAGWETREPAWVAAQVFAAARQQSIDLARVYLVGAGTGASYLAHHVESLSATFAAVVITGGSGQPTLALCPDHVLPAYFWVDAGDIAARTLRASFERCKQPVMGSAARGALDDATATKILDWLHRRVRTTTVAR